MWNLAQISLERCIVFLIFWPLSCVGIECWLWFPELWGISGPEGLNLYTHDPVDMIPISLRLWASEHTANNCTAPNSLPFSLHTQSLSNHSISQGLSVKSNPNALLEIVVCLVEKRKHVKPFRRCMKRARINHFAQLFIGEVM